MTLDRRRFLQLSTLSVMTAFADSACGVSRDRTDAAIERPQLLAMLGPERVRQIGTHYRASTPSENSTDSLRAVISSSRGFHIPFIGNGSLDDQIRDDLAAARTVPLDAWV